MTVYGLHASHEQTHPTELLAANMSVPQMQEFVGATSLAFLSVDGIYRALGHERRDARGSVLRAEPHL